MEFKDLQALVAKAGATRSKADSAKSFAERLGKMRRFYEDNAHVPLPVTILERDFLGSSGSSRLSQHLQEEGRPVILGLVRALELGCLREQKVATTEAATIEAQIQACIIDGGTTPAVEG